MRACVPSGARSIRARLDGPGRRFAVLLGAALALAFAPAVPAGASPAWSVVASPSPGAPATGSPASVSCPSPASCFAVGSFSIGAATIGSPSNRVETRAMVQHFDGTRWSIMASPFVADSQLAILESVACTSTTSCLAVGSYEPVGQAATGDVLLSERWNGTHWSIVPVPVPADAHENLLFHGIACTSAMRCDAVGSYETTSAAKVLTEHWNGTQWSVVPSADPVGSTSIQIALLEAISCPAPTTCLAVGQYDSTTTTSDSLLERWNGNAWSILANPPGPPEPNLRAIACTGTTSCLAVGRGTDTSNTPLSERWNGTSWSRVSTAPGVTDALLLDIACTNASNCKAVGVRDVGPSDTTGSTLVEHWNGTGWAVVASPNPTDTSGSDLLGIACPSAGDCHAVGRGQGQSGDVLLAEHWNGTSWTVDAPVGDASQSRLARVACPSVTNCFAVGSWQSATTTTMLIERGDGTTWTRLAPPSPVGAVSTSLSGVACVTATNCFAVGFYGVAGTGSRTLVEHWNGTGWAVSASPNPPGPDGGQLNAVMCTGATQCFAVGGTGDGSDGSPLAESWNGATWSIVAAPAPTGFSDSALDGIACTSPTSCDAVGAGDNNGVVPNRAVAEHWNGTSWSLATVQTPVGATYVGLSDVACATSANCFAVGTFTASATARTLIERWDGTGWSGALSIHPSSATSSALDGVTCAGSTSCTAVGSYRAQGGDLTVVQAWSGGIWAPVLSANAAGATDSMLRGVSCATPTNCAAVGNSLAQTSSYTLTERYA